MEKPWIKFEFGVELELTPKEVQDQMWLIIFGEFDILRPGDFEVEVSPGGLTVRILHPDPEVLTRLTESYTENRWKTWNMQRLTRAAIALSRLHFLESLKT